MKLKKVDVRIGQLDLDLLNPRIEKATSQLDALNRIVSSQTDKLYRLAADIVDIGLSPVERFMLLENPDHPGIYIALDGNRRTAALKLLSNPALDTQVPHFSTPEGRRLLDRFRQLRQNFDPKKIEPIEASVMDNRASADAWLRRKHAGELEGIGLTSWNRVESKRAFNPDDKLVALADFIRDEVLGQEEETLLSKQWSTIERLIDSEKLRARIGLDLEKGILRSKLTAQQLADRFRAIIEGLGKLDAPSRALNSVEDRMHHLETWLGNNDDLVESDQYVAVSTLRRLKETAKSTKATTKPQTTGTAARKVARERKTVMNKSDMHVSDERAVAVFRELCSLKAVDFPIASTVLLRVFLELSSKRYAKGQGMKTANSKGYDLPLIELIRTAHDKMKEWEPALDLEPVTRVLAAGTATHVIEHFHSVVHGTGTFPSRDSIMAASAEFRPFLKAIWERVI
ncbi:MAG: hypothetical protein ACOH2H_15140 [Cypionkella sp.]